MFHYAFCSSVCEMLAQFLLLTFFWPIQLANASNHKDVTFYHLNKYSFDFFIIFLEHPGEKKRKQHMKCHQNQRNLFTTVSQETFEFVRSLFPLVSISLSLFLPRPQSLSVS